MEREERRPISQQSSPKEQVEPEQQFEVTEREKYLLGVMAHIITEGYFPRIHRQDSESKQSIEAAMRATINKQTKVNL